MCTFADTANVDSRLSFADHEKQTSVFDVYINMYICKYTENGRPGVFLNPFTVCLSCKGKFIVCPFVSEKTNGSYPFANGL